HRHDNFQRKKYEEFNQRLPRPRDKIDHAASGLQNQKCQPKMAEDPKRTPATATIDFEFGLDFRLEDFVVMMDTTVVHTAEFAIDQSQIRKYGQAHRKKQCSKHVCPKVDSHANPSLRRKRRSIRFISPRSVS